MMKKFFLSTLFSMACIGMSAQGTKTEYELDPHWFLQLQGGAQYTLGEGKFGNLISPNVQFGIGYQFTPAFALRLQGNAWQSKGHWTTPDTEYKFNYIAPGLDLMFDVTNMIWGYNPKRLIDLNLFVGGGANIAWKNDEANALYDTYHPTGTGDDRIYVLSYNWTGTQVRAFGRAGVDLDFRLSDNVSLGVEFNANCLSDRYNSKRAHNLDWYFNTLAGVKIRLGNTNSEKVSAQPDVREVEKIVEKVVEKRVEVVKESAIRREIFFTINSTEIVENSEEKKVSEVADYLNRNKNAKVKITGYADKGTGNDKINNRLAAGRVDAVKQHLISKYGISESRIIADSEGDRVQPFDINDINRCVICIAE